MSYRISKEQQLALPAVPSSLPVAGMPAQTSAPKDPLSLQVPL